LFSRLNEDSRTAHAKDPAANTTLEVLLCYPDLYTIWLHRLAHWLWEHKLRLFGRLLSHICCLLTGFAIHPGPTIGRRFFINRGVALVIGETTEIGDLIADLEMAPKRATSAE